jgi:manganese transport protein
MLQRDWFSSRINSAASAEASALGSHVDAYLTANAKLTNVGGSRWLRLLGPAFVVSIGYIDPGNWATDLGAGTYGYRLLWVVLVASAIAIVLQMAVSELTIATGEDLATLISRRWPRLSPTFWAIFQGAAVATDVAEFSGIVLGVQLLFHWSLIASVIAGLAIVAAILTLTDRTSKGLEYALLGAVGIVSIGCLYELPIMHPAWGAVLQGATVPRVPDAAALVIAVGIIGATVMPHNLFLHSSLILKNCTGCTSDERKSRGRFFTRETLVALNVAAVINAAILIVGAALRGAHGSFESAFAELVPAGAGAAVVFSGALLISGIAASTTATVSGDYIFAAFSPLRISPVVRRAITIIPAALVIATGVSIPSLLIWSQVALALVLPIVLVPLVIIMSPLCGRKLVASTAGMAALCIAFDAVMLAQTIHG